MDRHGRVTDEHFTQMILLHHVHCGHTTTAILSFVTYFGVKVTFSSCSLSSFLITDKHPKCLGSD